MTSDMQERTNQKDHRIRKREWIKRVQPVAFDVLNRTIQKDHLFHAYLFYGSSDCFQSDMALWFAQSILANAKDGLLDEKEASPQQEWIASKVAENDYVDYIYLDGNRKKKLSKQEVDDLQDSFQKTSATKGNRKVYVIDRCENLTYEASNSILKFLEEPTSEVYAILTTEQIEKVLPTIQSRCLPLPFRSLPPSIRMELALLEGIDQEDAYLTTTLSLKGKSYGDVVVSEPYQHAKSMLKQAIGSNADRSMLLVDYETSYQCESKNDEDGTVRDANLDMLEMFFSMFIHFFQDVLVFQESGIAWYDNAVKQYLARSDAKLTATKSLGILLEQKDRLNRNNDLSLLMYQTIHRLEEII